MNEPQRYKKYRTIVTAALMIIIALLHLVTGGSYQGPFPAFVKGYLIDLLLPFGLYFLLGLPEIRVLESWPARGLFVFLGATAVELAQYRGIALFGRTFDPWDILMYGLGVLLAILLDQVVLPRIFDFWEPAAAPIEPHENSFIWRKH